MRSERRTGFIVLNKEYEFSSLSIKLLYSLPLFAIKTHFWPDMLQRWVQCTWQWSYHRCCPAHRCPPDGSVCQPWPPARPSHPSSRLPPHRSWTGWGRGWWLDPRYPGRRSSAWTGRRGDGQESAIRWMKLGGILLVSSQPREAFRAVRLRRARCPHCTCRAVSEWTRSCTCLGSIHSSSQARCWDSHLAPSPKASSFLKTIN